MVFSELYRRNKFGEWVFVGSLKIIELQDKMYYIKEFKGLLVYGSFYEKYKLKTTYFFFQFNTKIKFIAFINIYIIQ